MRALLIFGARPNYMKIAPLYRAMSREKGCEPVLVNTGQHFDRAMSSVFIDALGLPAPDVDLQVGGPGAVTQSQQISKIMHAIEPVMQTMEPDLAVVVGDVNSTVASALVASSLDVPVAHVEAGLRSGDWTMPEERNRVLTDRMSRYLFTPSSEADDNLRAEGIDSSRIHCVGNVMIDTLDWVLPRLNPQACRRKHGIAHGEFILTTLHRPINVDHPETLAEILHALDGLSQRLPIYFPVHPRTSERLKSFGLAPRSKRIKLLPPLDYLDFIALMSQSALVISDSGGIQEETTVLGVPCLTLRQNTERPITLKYGQNELVNSECESIVCAADRMLSQGRIEPQRPPLWDGQAAQRTVAVLMNELNVCRTRLPEKMVSNDHEFAAIILAGGIRPSPLVDALGMPTPCLPLSQRQTLLSAWLEAIANAGRCNSTTIVVSSEPDARAMRSLLERIQKTEPTDFRVDVMIEPTRWRGPGGIMRDVAAQMVRGDCVLMVEGACFPPAGLNKLVRNLVPPTIATVGVGPLQQPAGAYAVLREAFTFVPSIGFFDIKEQLLPELYSQGRGAKAVEISDQVIRLRNRVGYLQAVAAHELSNAQSGRRKPPILARGVSPDARIIGRSLIANGAVVEADAVVHDSIVLEGAMIRSGAVVSRSVVGYGVEIERERVVTDAMVPSVHAVAMRQTFVNRDRKRPGLLLGQR